MPEMILPGTYIEVRPEGLIAPGQVTVGNVGVLGTASKGPVGSPVLLSNYNDAVATFGPYDAFYALNDPKTARSNSLTLVRALELAFSHGASTVYAVRVQNGGGAGIATAELKSSAGAKDCVELDAASPGDWGNATTVVVSAPAAGDVVMVTQTSAKLTAADKSFNLTHAAAVPVSGRNRVTVRKPDGSVVALPLDSSATPGAGKAFIEAGKVDWADSYQDGFVTAEYAVDSTLVRKVAITNGTTKESYLVISGDQLVQQINDPQTGSQLVGAKASLHSDEAPDLQIHTLTGGSNGNAGAVYSGANGLDALLDADVHIIVAAGQSDVQAGAALDAHCQKASDDVYKRDRIAVVGSGPMGNDRGKYVDALIGNTLASDRVVFVAPGIKTTSTAPDEPNPSVTLPGTYTAAAIAGMLATLSPHLSLTNKTVSVDDLEVRFNNAELTELVQNRVTALEVHRGIHVLRGQTTSDGPFREITTRRIVDYAKYGVRSAAAPYIGLLNNDRVRGALRATIDSFLKEMLDDEMLVTYSLEVTATRAQQIAGIAQVTITLQPVFSINFIKVTMTLS